MRYKHVLTVSAAVAMGALAQAQDSHKIDTDVTLEFASKYVWHGISLVNDWVFQPGVSLTQGNLNVSFWGDMELTNWNEPNFPVAPRGHFTEIDTTTDYSGTLKNCDWTIGLAHYQFPGTGWLRYSESYLILTDSKAPGSPTLSLYSGLNTRTGFYATLGLSHSVALKGCRAQSLDLGFELTGCDTRCSNYLYGVNVSGITDIHLTAAVGVPFGKSWNLTTTANYSKIVRSQIMQGEPRRENTWISIAATTKI